MEQTCHRCGTTVSRQDAFCPVCGAPQLHFDGSEQPAFGEGTDASAPPERPGQVSWKVALGACAKIAIPAGVLCALPLLSVGSLIWVAGGAGAVIFLYRRKRPMALLNTRGGLRIGALTGLMMAYVYIAASAVLGVVQRFSLHNGSAVDEAYAQLINQSRASLQTTPETQATLHSMYTFMLTPDGRAAYSLMGMVMATLLTVTIAAVGGAVGVRMFRRRAV